MEKCELCNTEFATKQSLAGHIGSGHKISMEEYIIKIKYNNIPPKCGLCEERPSFVRGKNIYRKYCSSHSNEGRKEWSSKNKTFDYGWKKGLTKKDHSGILSQATKISGVNNPWFGKSLPEHVLTMASKSRAEKITLTNEEFIKRATNKYNNKYDYSLIKYTGSKVKIEIKCNIHNTLFFQKPNDHLSGYEGCVQCSPVGFSKQEKNIVDFIKTFYSGEVIENDRIQLKPKEIDIFIPEKNFAIEFNGLHWHSDDFIDKNSHSLKTQECIRKNINLFHVFSDEWENKQEIVKSMIRYRMGFVPRKIHARKCHIKQVTSNDGKTFFQNTHIAGDNRATIYFGLFYEGEMISCISLKKPIQKKYGNVIEIARFANLLNTTVQGGFQKLLKEIKNYAQTNKFDSILTYADLRFGEGKTYLKGGFSLIGKSPLDYWYTDGQKREFRFKYRAQKPLSERQVAENAGVVPVYGCGSNIYIYKI